MAGEDVREGTSLRSKAAVDGRGGDMALLRFSGGPLQSQSGISCFRDVCTHRRA